MSVEAPQIIKDLVKRFDENKHVYTSGSYDEENTKIEFINPFFEALGWDVSNKMGASARYKEVVFEDTIKINGKAKAPDYSFRLGGQRVFFVEAKKPSVNIETDKNPAFQVRRYGWSAKLPLCILTDFEELAVYETNIKPDKRQNASIGRVKYYKYTDYVEKWDEISSIFSKEAVMTGAFDNFVTGHKGIKKGTSEVDDEFLKEIDNWRLLLARNIAIRNKDLSIEELNHAVQLTIDRIIFLKMAEDRGIEKYGQLQKMLELANNDKDDYPVYREFIELCKKADAKYNSGLFHFTEEKDINLDADYLTPNLKIDDGVFKEIFKNMYYPDCPYEFSMISTEILGSIYERFLGKKIRLTNSHQAKVEEKPDVKKAGGVFYTPQYIVDYIVENTIGELIKGKTPNQVSKMRFVDPACGSGTFLLGAFQYLIDWHLDYYSNMERPPKDVIYTGRDGITRLTINEKKRIVVNNIYGVDIDAQAVEVSKLSLLLKVLEDSNKDVLEAQQKLFQERALPYLGDNIRCGNSLIGTDILETNDLTLEEVKNINPFDWKDTFKEVFENGGFDAIIGNPPYVNITNINNPSKDYLKNNYLSEKRFDLYVLFMEKTLDLLKLGGLHGFIIPDKFCNQNYSQIVRNLLLNNVQINKIVDFRQFKLFKKASVKNIVYLFKNQKPNQNNEIEMIKPTEENINLGAIKGNSYFIKQSIFSSLPDEMFRLDWNYEKGKIIEKIESNSVKLKEICYCSFGFQPGTLSKFTFNMLKNPERASEHPDSIKKFIRGRNIKPYFIDFDEDYVFYLPNELHRPAFSDLFENPKIVISEICQDIQATYDSDKFYGNEKTINVLPWKDMNNVDKNIIQRRGIKFDEENIDLSNKISLKFILSLLNSNLMQFYFKLMLSDDINVYPDNVRNLPIFKNDNEYDLDLSNLVDKMLDLNKKLANCKTPNEKRLLEKQIEVTDKKINQLVYELYDLTDEEIAIVEESLN